MRDRRKNSALRCVHIPGQKSDPEDICRVNIVDSSCHLPNLDVHTPMVRLGEGQGDSWWEDGRQRDAVMPVRWWSQEHVEGWGWLDQTGSKSMPDKPHRSQWHICQLWSECITARISNAVAQVGPLEWHNIFSKRSGICIICDNWGIYVITLKYHCVTWRLHAKNVCTK